MKPVWILSHGHPLPILLPLLLPSDHLSFLRRPSTVGASTLCFHLHPYVDRKKHNTLLAVVSGFSNSTTPSGHAESSSFVKIGGRCFKETLVPTLLYQARGAVHDTGTPKKASLCHLPSLTKYEVAPHRHPCHLC